MNPKPVHLQLVSSANELTLFDAEQITSRIRQWVNEFPREDVIRAYLGRIWLAMDYGSWAEWCEREIDVFKFRGMIRQQIVAELAESGMSNTAIAEAIGVDQSTVYRDQLKSGFANANPVTGLDGKTYTKPEPKPAEPEPEKPCPDWRNQPEPEPEDPNLDALDWFAVDARCVADGLETASSELDAAMDDAGKISNLDGLDAENAEMYSHQFAECSKMFDAYDETFAANYDAFQKVYAQIREKVAAHAKDADE
jgi:transposase-like protein